MNTLAELKRKFRSAWPHLDERTRRILAGNEAVSLGYGGVSLVRRAGGLSRKAIAKGIREIQKGSRPLVGRIRRPGAGRKSPTQSDPGLVRTLEALIEDQTRGDPESALRWICKSTRAIARELGQQKHPVSHMKVAQILHDLDYSLQSNRKTEEGADHPDRDAQFRHINATVKQCLRQGIPVISVDTKKKELVGNYENSGRQWLPAKQPRQVQGHDFPNPKVPRAYPYGIYDIGRNAGFVNVGTDHDTGAFAVASIRGWWRLRLWKLELQNFADQTGRCVAVCHLPPGTSKWNKVEHRLFSFISSNWRGEPLRDYETVVHLIARTTTAKGLKVTCQLDRRRYQRGAKGSNAEMARVNLERNKFHVEWNYIIKPNVKTN
ncbi:MAG: ISAzo13 family transposase [Acidobacteria bacterium]|nr:ISAzo13 family transposase [Acidobacteriota bacterium]